MRYFWATLKYKWFVLLASFKTGLPLWLAITHDLSKFTRAELPHYSRQFFGDKGDPEGFALAWLHHQNRHDHHPEWWITRATHSHAREPTTGDCLPMSDVAITHMITDWLGAGRAYEGSWDISDWLDSHLPKMKVHPATMIKIVSELERLGIWQGEGALFILQCFGLVDKQEAE